MFGLRGFAFFRQASRENEAIRVFQVMFRMNMWRKRRDLPVQRRQHIDLYSSIIKRRKDHGINQSQCAQLCEGI